MLWQRFGGIVNKKNKKDSDDILQTYFDQIKAFPLLQFEEELVLSRLIQDGNGEALHKLINANLRLVVKIARAFTSSDVSIMDLIQEGNMGLMHAAEKYDYLKNVRFCTYASWWIRQFICRYLVNKRRMVRLPHRKEAILKRIQHSYHSLSQTLMHQPRTSEIADELGLSVEDIDSVIGMSSSPLPLESEAWDKANTAVMELHEDYTYSPERTILRQFSRDGALRFLDYLKDREKRIITYRYQLDGCEHHTLKKIGDKMGISPETVRQIEMKALNKIRSRAEELKACVYMEAI
jgi:RNA polymerase primary sigma factor